MLLTSMIEMDTSPLMPSGLAIHAYDLERSVDFGIEPQAGPSGTSHDDVPLPVPQAEYVPPPPLAPSSSTDLTTLRAAMEEMVRMYIVLFDGTVSYGFILQILPIRDQMQTLNANFDEVSRNAAETTALRAQIATLSGEVAALRLQASRSANLEAEVSMLKEHISAMREMSSLDSIRTRTESGETTDKGLAR